MLDFLFAANLEAADAFGAAKSFLEAGIRTREDIAALTPERAKSLTEKKCHRKLLTALRKMPTLEGAPADQGPSPKRHAGGGSVPPPPERPALHSFPEGVVINRSPVMILWAAACASVGTTRYSWAEALSLGSACAAIFARSKGRALGLHGSGGSSSSASSSSAAEPVEVHLLGQAVPAMRGSDGSVRGLSESRQHERQKEGLLDVVHPAATFRSLSNAFGARYKLSNLALGHLPSPLVPKSLFPTCSSQPAPRVSSHSPAFESLSRASFGATWHAMLDLAAAVPPASLAANGGTLGYDLYARFRPNVPQGLAGWGQPGRLELAKLAELRQRYAGGGEGRSAHGSQPSSATTSAAPTAAAPAPAPASAPVAKVDDAPASAPAPAPVAKVEDEAVASQAQLLSEIEQRAAAGGATMDELALALGDGTALGVARVRGWVEELQLDGLVYERAGRMLPL